MIGSRISRRRFLAAAAATAAASAGMCHANEQPARKTDEQTFLHRAINGWITDLATEPDPNARWPSMRLDERLLEDYRNTLRLMRQLGFNEAVIWGLYVANNWPVDIRSAVTPERGKLVERLIAEAHENGIRVLSGLGVYSWGFAEILRTHPELRGGNANAICGSREESHKWMQRVVDFVFDRFDIDGVSMQSADQGRCRCDQCKAVSDAEYHSRLISRTAEYIRSKWPDKTLGMSNWGMPFHRREDRASLSRMSRSLDYMIDHNNSVRRSGLDYRREFIRGLDCCFGTSGGPVVEPPQHWQRDRWFLPTCRRVHEHLEQLAADGGRACEFFFHILANPSSEITFHIAGRTLASPETPLDKLMSDAVRQIYRPRSRAAQAELVQLFLDAEEAYFRHLPPNLCSTISLEPLVSSRPGPPVYLRKRLNDQQRLDYCRDIERLSRELQHLSGQFGERRRLELAATCMRNVLHDVRG